MPLELLDTDTLSLTAYLDAAGELQLRHGETELADYADHVLVRSSATTIHVSVESPQAAPLSVSHEDDEGELVDWVEGSYAFEHPTTDPLEVTLATDASATTTASKTKKLKIEAKPGGALPDRS